MQKYSNEWENPNNIQWFTQLHQDGIPLEYRGVFYPLLNELITHYKKLIKDIIDSSVNELSLPMETNLFQNYLSGWTLNYISFDGTLEGKSGYWERDDENDDMVNIYYNINETKKRQRFTKIHETIHFCQWLDQSFLDFFDNIIISELLPPELIIKLLEKATNKATAIYLMPNQYFRQKWQETKSVKELSEYFQVSEGSVAYRLKECEII